MHNATRKPKPDWSRPGETWRIEEEPGWWIAAPGHICASHTEGPNGLPCTRKAVARSGKGLFWCEQHMDGRWIEDRKVVGWVLRRAVVTAALVRPLIQSFGRAA